MRLDILSLIVVCMCIGGGYLVFIYGYVPDDKLGWYDLEFELNEENEFLTIIGGSHPYFELRRDQHDSTEFVTIRNNIDEKLTMNFAYNGNTAKQFTIDFPSLGDEKFFMIMDLLIKELIISIAGIMGVLMIQRIKNKKPKEDNEWSTKNE